MRRRIAHSVGNFESKRNYVVNIKLSTGGVNTVIKQAHSEYHAVDLAFSDNINGDGPYQYDRSKYEVVNNFKPSSIATFIDPAGGYD